MKLNRLIGLVLVLGLVLPLAVACGPAKLGTEKNHLARGDKGLFCGG